MPDCGSTTAAPSVRTCTRSIPKGAKPTRSSTAWARCTPGTCCRHAWASPTKLTADGRTVLRASYGRFNQGVLTGEFSRIPPRCDPDHDGRLRSRDRRLHDASSRWSIPESTCSSIRETRAPRTDEYSIGVDREVGRRLAVAIAYVRKDGSNFIGWTDVGGQYREETRTLPDGRSVPVFVLANSHGRTPFPVDESGGILADVQRARDGGRETPVRRMAGVWLVYVVEGVGAAGLQRDDARRARRSAPSPAPPQLTFGQDPNV